jgi:alpha-L-fucosidase
MALPINPPHPYGAVPSARQAAWHALEYYGFLHFTINTFTDREWGHGDESPQVFNPTDFSADQMVETAALGGMKGLILTAKHHDGFCLWPSDYTDHSVKSSPWCGGKGDVVGEIAAACQRHGLKFGVYLSPWDRHHPDYGSPVYIRYYRNQLRELLTRYGPLFEIWFDGANGGDGYYGGKYEKRSIDGRTYYEWEETFALVRELQKEACIFNPPGSDIRWVGNERGIAGDPCWHTWNPEGEESIENLNRGFRDGSIWWPAEVDVSIRPGWFYHRREDSLVRTPKNLFNLYLQSVGRGANLLLNLPPTRAGRIHPRDRTYLIRFNQMLADTFSIDLARQAAAGASSTRGNSPEYNPKNIVDGSSATFWVAGDEIRTAEINLDFPNPVTFNLISLREPIALGQRIDDYTIDVWKGGNWQPIYAGQMIGSYRLALLPDQTTNRVRLRISGAKSSPALREVGLYYHNPRQPGALLDWFYEKVFPRIP